MLIVDYIAEAERAAAEAMWVTEHYPVDENDMRLPSADHPDFVQMEVMTYPSARAAVAAVVPILAEHFAQAVEAFADMDGDWIGPTDPDAIMRRAARLIREDATPTEGGAT